MNNPPHEYPLDPYAWIDVHRAAQARFFDPPPTVSDLRFVANRVDPVNFATLSPPPPGLPEPPLKIQVLVEPNDSPLPELPELRRFARSTVSANGDVPRLDGVLRHRELPHGQSRFHVRVLETCPQDRRPRTTVELLRRLRPMRRYMFVGPRSLGSSQPGSRHEPPIDGVEMEIDCLRHAQTPRAVLIGPNDSIDTVYTRMSPTLYRDVLIMALASTLEYLEKCNAYRLALDHSEAQRERARRPRKKRGKTSLWARIASHVLTSAPALQTQEDGFRDAFMEHLLNFPWSEHAFEISTASGVVDDVVLVNKDGSTSKHWPHNDKRRRSYRDRWKLEVRVLGSRVDGGRGESIRAETMARYAYELKPVDG